MKTHSLNTQRTQSTQRTQRTFSFKDAKDFFIHLRRIYILFSSTYFMCFHSLKTYLYNISLDNISQHLKSKKITFLLIFLKRSINRKLIYLNQNKINQYLDLKRFKMFGFFCEGSV